MFNLFVYYLCISKSTYNINNFCFLFSTQVIYS
nr:MAG TPA: hypothetical protein [Caudoviricetes sp.]DAQ77206.1 MAG TPA: hypothetical protein [Caudoviricetes sp.]